MSPSDSDVRSTGGEGGAVDSEARREKGEYWVGDCDWRGGVGWVWEDVGEESSAAANDDFAGWPEVYRDSVNGDAQPTGYESGTVESESRRNGCEYLIIESECREG